jgi:hypothetical protein
MATATRAATCSNLLAFIFPYPPGAERGRNKPPRTQLCMLGLIPYECLTSGAPDFICFWPKVMLATKNGQSDQALVDASKASGAT